MPLIPRHLIATVSRALTASRIVNIIGPRQSGKSTFVRALVRSAIYVSLADEVTRRALASDPYGQLQALSAGAKGSGRPIVIDEVQRLPKITLPLKRIVDEDGRRGHFLLAGSFDIFTSRKAPDSLAGRVSTLMLRPFSAAEIFGTGPCLVLDAVAKAPNNPVPLLPGPRAYQRADVIDLIIRGGFPDIRGLTDRDRVDRCSDYLDTIIERDLSAIHAIRNSDAARRLIGHVAGGTAQELNTSSLSRELGVKNDTVSDYLDALARIGIVRRLGAWSSGMAKREIRAPKLHLMDTGLATTVRGEDSGSFGIRADPTTLASLFETFVFLELEKSLPFLAMPWTLWHWRGNGRRIDIVAEAPGRRLVLFKVKSSTAVEARDCRHIDWFLTQGPGKAYRGAGFIVYLGDHLLSFGPGRIALPASMFWSFPSATKTSAPFGAT